LHLDDDNSFEPDLFWISPENAQCFLEENGRYWRGAPDLVVEILSPSTASDDRGVKFEVYQKHGVGEYWLVDPEAKFVEVHRLEGRKFARQGVYKPNQPFVSAALSGATINSQDWFSE
jgi:Uma2 family endonuclease